MGDTEPASETDSKWDTSLMVRCSSGFKKRVNVRAAELGYSNMSQYIRDTLREDMDGSEFDLSDDGRDREEIEA